MVVFDSECVMLTRNGYCWHGDCVFTGIQNSGGAGKRGESVAILQVMLEGAEVMAAQLA